MRTAAVYAAGLLACSAITAPAALAQDEGGDVFTPPEDDRVIIVTATRRAENLQEVPLAVTAVSTEDLDRQGVTDIRNLAAVAPSFNINSSDTETQGTTIRIRGVGTTGNNIGLESAVAVFLDGVYLSRPGAALGDLVDVERVEILRGPQGTLFGRNTTAGALNITTKLPDLDIVEGFANASYGNFDFVNVQAGVSLPVVDDTLGVRLSGAYRRRDGVLTNQLGEDLNDRDRYSLRGQVYWEPSADVSLRLIADFASADESCCAALIVRESELFSAPALIANGLPADGGAPFIGEEFLDQRLTNTTSDLVNGYDNLGLSAELNWDFSDSASLTYIGSWRDFDDFSSRSTDFVGLAVFSVGEGDSIFDGGGPNRGEIETWTHELRLQGEAFDDVLEWLVGVYYSDEQISTQRGVLGLGPDYEAYINTFLLSAGQPDADTLAFIGTGGLQGNPNAVTDAVFTGAFADNRFSQDAESLAFFTHNTVNITDTLGFVFGLRYTEDRKDGAFEQAAASNPGCSATNPAFGATGLNGLLCFAFASPVGDADTVGLPREFGNGALGGAFDEFNDDQLIYTAKLLWEPTPDINTYLSVTTGYKSGGFNLDASATLEAADNPVGVADPRFDSETIDAYELGVKTTLFGGDGTLNIAVFHQELENFQVLEFTGVSFQTFNVPSAKATGFEIDFNAQVTPTFALNAAMTYSDARYPSDCIEGDISALVAAGLVETAANLCGADLTNAPAFVGNLGLIYENEITSSGWVMTASANMRYESDRRTSTQPSEIGAAFTTPLPFDVQNGNARINARLGFTTPDEAFTFEVWGNNLTDYIARNVTFNTPLRGTANVRSRGAYIEDPRTYGVTVRTKF
ncbi:TonB-dependent receptor [Erythrobacter sp.]|jgi:outer membrane receptor protein involved in Fe transport|uniref:TonB-dependent receptor n=1 Tax=Erythrobacter sp. TaxID=1042 RepID=UPI002EBF1143|nr:TonB-dependent receptor [Erythrobacter sp.]